MGAGYEVSFIDKAVEGWLRNEAPDDGLCLKRFRADFTVDGLNSLEEGAVIHKNGSEYVIVKTGKRCFDECDLLKRTGRPCPLSDGVAFGERKI